MTLDEAKDVVAKENGWDNWKHILYSDSLSQEAKYILLDMASIRYAREKYNDAIEEMKSISYLISDVEIPEFEP